MKHSKYAFDVRNLKTMNERPWELAMPAFRVMGNLFFVGNRDGASWLLDTQEGLVLFDTNYPTADALLLHSIWSLGFDPSRIVAIVHTHGHFDHFGATELIRALSGAKTYLGEADARMFGQRPELSCIGDVRNAYLALFQPDVIVRDGDSFCFGQTTLQAVSCPGHSPGATSWFFSVTGDDGKAYRVGLHGGAGLNTLCRDYREEHHVDWRDNFADSIQKVINEPVDIFLGNHTGQNRTEEKLKRMQAGDTNAFVNPYEWREFLQDLEKRFRQMLLEEESGMDQMDDA